jgi:phosphatidylserine decarboxylase
VALVKHCSGQFLNAMRADCGQFNENVLIGFESAEVSGQKVAIRLIAGLIARRIVPWVQRDEVVAKGDRISLIQFGSRVDVYMPLDAHVQVKLGDKVKGGESIIALRA